VKKWKNKGWVRVLSVARHLGLYYRVFVPLLSADTVASCNKLEDLVDCKGRTLTDDELANLMAAQIFIKRIMLQSTDPNIL
jgi:hypothetical protein